MKHEPVLIVDIEATCWLNHQAPPGEESEIIEIGVCLLHDSQIIASESILVKPQRSRVSPFCTKLTTLTQEMVDQGTSFAAACERLRSEYAAPMWASWGKYDRQMFWEQCHKLGVAYPFSQRHINLKTAFPRLHNTRVMGMAAALRFAGLSLDGTHHRGVDDARNIARLLVVMLDKFGIEMLQAN